MLSWDNFLPQGFGLGKIFFSFLWEEGFFGIGINFVDKILYVSCNRTLVFRSLDQFGIRIGFGEWDMGWLGVGGWEW